VLQESLLSCIPNQGAVLSNWKIKRVSLYLKNRSWRCGFFYLGFWKTLMLLPWLSCWTKTQCLLIEREEGTQIFWLTYTLG